MMEMIETTPNLTPNAANIQYLIRSKQRKGELGSITSKWAN
jgi:hypothetical protein